ncbi:MAG: Bifunctional homocysteine S-methyltransferase/5,10-methylenetetrahydrofolate reductase [Chroococcopsis gigantea SAG 12.99]|jgi:methylenetetrahydrofolate reductase (NADPH)|nr:methylenetetrahydrofolate reductase [Chlorogloea purpurea SAG 13.99]MDV2999646.1 Bifunctional homocysteine S-methyltransferase/5,10-methylenetetrahydrofolate reductase [Chroococcopsis gigantea SAG 12.99]
MNTRLRSAAQNQEFLITAEITPPKGGDTSHLIELGLKLKDRVHGVNITDGSRAVMQMSSIAASAILLQQGVEPICQIACRDRNVIGLQADLLGAYALGIRNILALTGDPVKAGDHPGAKSVFELESVRLLKLIHKLNNAIDHNEKPLPDGGLNLFAGAAVDPQCNSWSGLQRRFEQKIEAGAQFFQSQMVTDFDRFDKFMHQIASIADKPVLAGIFLLKSAKNALFIRKNVPGVHIPDETIERLRNAPQPLEEGMKIAAEQIVKARQLCQGVHIMAIKKEELVPQILDLAGIEPVS